MTTFALTDARGCKSTTLFIVMMCSVAVIIKFLLAGLSFPVIGTIPLMTGGEFAAAEGALLAAWVAREYGDKRVIRFGKGGDASEE